MFGICNNLQFQPLNSSGRSALLFWTRYAVALFVRGVLGWIHICSVLQDMERRGLEDDDSVDGVLVSWICVLHFLRLGPVHLGYEFLRSGLEDVTAVGVDRHGTEKYSLDVLPQFCGGNRHDGLCDEETVFYVRCTATVRDILATLGQHRTQHHTRLGVLLFEPSSGTELARDVAASLGPVCGRSGHSVMWIVWKCVVCARQNNNPHRPPPENSRTWREAPPMDRDASPDERAYIMRTFSLRYNERDIR